MIDPNRVTEILKDCLYAEEADVSNMVQVEGVVNNFGFDPAKLEVHRDEILTMLLELPDEFMESEGGGYSMLKGCVDRHGEQWTGFQSVVDELFCLGIGVGYGKWLLPRPMWKVLPGNLPYYIVLDRT